MVITHTYARTHTYIGTYINGYSHKHKCIHMRIYECAYRVAKTHRMPYPHRSFSAKESYN